MPLIELKSSLLSLNYYQPNFNKVVGEGVEDKLEATLEASFKGEGPVLYTEQNKYGKDRFGDVPYSPNSGLPYIRTKIPGRPSNYTAGTRDPIINPTTAGGLDYPIRGGQIAFELGQQTYTSYSKLDKDRIKLFLDDSPRGVEFITKQIGLQRTNPKIETGMMYGMEQNTRVYAVTGESRYPINMMAQIGSSGTGAHAHRHGSPPFNPLQQNYFATVNEQNIIGRGAAATGINRLVILKALKMISRTNPILNTEEARDLGISVNMTRVNELGISLNRNTLFQYIGGPGSSYGIGGTTIPRYENTTETGNANLAIFGRTAMTYDQLSKMKSNRDNIKDRPAQNIQDFRLKLKGLVQGDVWGPKQGVDFRFYDNRVDKINSMYPFEFNSGTAPWEKNSNTTDDLIKFVFEAINNDDPSISTAIFFRAFLTTGITDSNTAAYNNFKYIGRGENFYTYQGFDRTITFSFRVAAQSKSELIPMYNRLNSLVSQVYPDYSPTTSIMRAPLMRITIGDYLFRMPGFIESVNLTTLFDSSWEIENGSQLPHAVDVNITFKPIPNELPRRYGNIIARAESKTSPLMASQQNSTAASQVTAVPLRTTSTPESNTTATFDTFIGPQPMTMPTTDIAQSTNPSAVSDPAVSVNRGILVNESIASRRIKINYGENYRANYPNLFGIRRYSPKHNRALPPQEYSSGADSTSYTIGEGI